MWSTATLTPLFRITPHLDTDSGDLFSLAWAPTLSTIYFGCQNTSLQWYTFPSDHKDGISIVSSRSETPSSLDSFGTSLSGTSTPRRAHKFFDSYPQYTRRAADLLARNSHRNSPSPESLSPVLDDCLSPAALRPVVSLEVPASNMNWSAHYGYVYCMALSPSTYDGSDDKPPGEHDSIRLVTGSGDSTVKVRASL